MWTSGNNEQRYHDIAMIKRLLLYLLRSIRMQLNITMMVKIKSEVGLKRALRLIPLLMEKLGASAGEKKNVDYAEMYPFKTDDELLEAGLIKMQATAKTGFNF